MAEQLHTLHLLFRQIALDFGEEVLTENRLKGILCDYGGMNVNKFQHIITRSISYKMGQKLLTIKNLDDADYKLKLNNLRQVFQEENFLRHDIANYMIDCYLFAFGWIDTVREFDEDENDSYGLRIGELSFTEHSGLDYCGNYNEDKERSGFGIAKDSESNYYAGEWKLNMKNGVGMEVNTKRNKYAGEWRLNRRAGVGAEIMPDGNRYTGEWKNGKMNGCGIVIYPNGEKMCTTFRNGRPNEDSIGIYYLKDDSYVIGHMTEKGPEGRCKHFQKEGIFKEEIWKDGIQL